MVKLWFFNIFCEARDMYLDAMANMEFTAMFNPYERVDQFALKDEPRSPKKKFRVSAAKKLKAGKKSSYSLQDLVEEVIETSNYGGIDASNFGSKARSI